jgi:phosphopantetheinyl transferase (holo-ACP synthase)
VRLAGTKRWRIALSMSHSVEVAVAIAIITARL